MKKGSQHHRKEQGEGRREKREERREKREERKEKRAKKTRKNKKPENLMGLGGEGGLFIVYSWCDQRHLTVPKLLRLIGY